MNTPRALFLSATLLLLLPFHAAASARQYLAKPEVWFAGGEATRPEASAPEGTEAEGAEGPGAEPVDLLRVAGVPVAKRVAGAAAMVGLAVFVAIVIRRKSR